MSTPTFLLSTPVDNSKATWKKATKRNKKTDILKIKVNENTMYFVILEILDYHLVQLAYDSLITIDDDYSKSIYQKCKRGLSFFKP